MELAFLEPTATIAQIEDICTKAVEEKYRVLTVPPLFVKKAKELLAGEDIKISTVVGYPYGWSVIESKLAEVIMAMIDGADELDIVINHTALLNNDWQYLAKELNTLMTVVRKQQRFINIVLESAIMPEEDITRCCDLYGAAGVDCLILSGGSARALPAPAIVQMVRQQLADKISIKLWVEDTVATVQFEAAGTDRIGILVK